MYIRIITAVYMYRRRMSGYMLCGMGDCHWWQKLEKYRAYPGGFGNRLRNSINFKRKSFKQYDRRCAFLNEENLCDIYTEAGEKLFCKTCRQYPRHEEEYENVRELSLSLSCPEQRGWFCHRQTESHLWWEKKGIQRTMEILMNCCFHSFWTAGMLSGNW